MIGRLGNAAGPPVAVDLVTGVALCILDLLAFWAPSPSAPAVLVIPFAVVAYSLFGWARARPGTVFVVICLHSAVALALFPDYRPTLSLLLALAIVTALRSRRASLLALSAAALVDSLAVLDEWRRAAPPDRTDAVLVSTVSYLLLNATAWAVGNWRRSHRAYILESHRREQAEAEVAVAAERSRIAAELHDIVAHAVTVMVLQAAGARRTISADDSVVGHALANIEEAGRQAMSELRRLLVLVSGDQPDAAPLGPRPGVGDLPSLVQVMRSTGLQVELTETGSTLPLAPGVDLAAFRVVQEALTNAAKYAGPGARVTVRLDWRESALSLTIRDHGPRGPAPARSLSNGHGLANLQERVRSACGHLEAGPVPSGGFQVQADLPAADQSTLALPTAGGSR